MKTLDFGGYALGICAAVGMLSGCGSPAPLAPAGSLAGDGTARHVSPDSSWMDPAAVGTFLLYVSNGDGIVNVYRYWQHTLVGELTNFTKPEGECTDGSGNVYITDYGSGEIVEYAHGGKTPLRTINDSPYKPYGCAINLKNGDLAVANYSQSSYYSEGNVAVYAGAKGKPAYYSNKYLYHVNACAYDKYGDLLATGFYLYSGYYLYTNFAYLPAKSKDFEQIDLPPSSSYGWGAVQGVGWDGEYWTVEAYDDLYQYTINIKPELIGTVKLEGDSGPVAFYSTDPNKQATQAVGAYSFESTSYVYYWKYPAGGEPVEQVTHGLDEPFGVAISVRK